MKNDTRFSNNRRMIYFAGSVLISCFVILFTLNLMARIDGITGQAETNTGGCTCHNTNPNSNTSVSISSQTGSFTVYTGSTTRFTVTVSNSAQSAGGVNIAARTSQNGGSNIGTLSTISGQGLQLLDNELTHTYRKTFSGGSASFDFNWIAPSSPGTYYILTAGNAVNANGNNSGDEWNFMSAQTITVQAAPSITVSTPNGGEQWCTGSGFDIEWNATNVSNVKIELSSDGGSSYPTVLVASVSAASGSWTWNITGGQSIGNSYRVKITDVSNSDVNDEGNGIFSISGPVAITSQPQPVDECTTNLVSFTVTATGAGLEYQWRKNSTNISGADVSVYTINSVAESDAGIYEVVIIDACNNEVTSDPAELSVNVTPNITSQPSSQEKCAGESITLSVNAIGTGINYQWQKDGEDIPGTNTDELVLDNVTSDDSGDYRVLVSGTCVPADMSDVATVTVKTPPRIVTQPENISACLGQQLIISVEAEGDDLVYQWRKNGSTIPNSNSSSITIEEVLDDDAGSYDVRISGSCDPFIMSNASTVTVNRKPEVTKDPASLTVEEGSSVEFTIAYNGFVDIFQWSRNQINLQGETSAKLTIANVLPSHAGYYDCKLINSCGEALTKQAELIVNPATSGPKLTLSQSVINFGPVQKGESKEMIFEALIRNPGDENLIISTISLDGDDAASFSFEDMNLPLTLTSGESTDMTLTFSPQNVGNLIAEVLFESNAQINPTLMLTGTGSDISFSLSATELLFGDVMLNEKATNSFVIENTGTENLEFNLSFSGDAADLFSLSDVISPLTLNAGESKEINIELNATREGEVRAKLDGEYVSDEEVNFEVNLRGDVVLSSVIEDIISDNINIYPNPSTEGVTIEFILNEPVNYVILIFDLQGRLVKRFESNFQRIGKQQIIWDGLDDNGVLLTSGRYNAVLSIGTSKVAFPIVIGL